MQQSFQELWGYSRPVTFHGEGDLAKKEGAAQMQAGICVGRAHWAAEAL